MRSGFARVTALFLSVLLVALGPLSHAQDGAVETITVAGGEAPMPIVGDGAPNYSPEQTAGMICTALTRGSSNDILYRLEKAHESTVRARDARREFRLGKSSEGRMNATERQRQQAIQVAASIVTLASLPQGVKDGLVAQPVSYRRIIENGRPVMLITTTVRNTSDGRRFVPPVTLHAIDARDFVLASQVGAIEPEILEPGQSHQFVFRFRNPPAYAVKFHAAFAPPFPVRAFRGCAFFDPRRLDTARLDVQRLRNNEMFAIERPEGRGAPPYLTAELALLAKLTFEDAQDAYIVTEARRAVGGDPEGRCAPMQSWQELFRLADRIEDAWIAGQAAEEVRRDAERGVFLPEEVDEAYRARADAIHTFMKARPPSRANAARPNGLVLESWERRARANGADTVAVAGAIRNEGSTLAREPSVLLTVKDEFGHLVTERFYRAPINVEPGATRRFVMDISLPPRLTKDITMRLVC